MDFDRSSQAKSWLFDEQSLHACRAQSTTPHEIDVRKPRVRTVRKFASGFHRSSASRKFNPCTADLLEPEQQESLVRFHAHQMQTLVGPTAILPELRTSVTVLSTAIMLFRRFYLSNSVLYFNPRKMAAACAFFAAKSEEEKIEIGLLSHATSVVHSKVQHVPLCRNELRGVSVFDIQDYEKLLMEGTNYEFKCHHPFSAMHALAIDYSNFSSKRGVFVDVDDLLERASAVVQRALVFSDANFMFAPGHIGFAAVAIALGSTQGENGFIGDGLKTYLLDRFARKVRSELDNFEAAVSRIIQCLFQCKHMDLAPEGTVDIKHAVVAQRAEEMKLVLRKVSSIRMHLFHRQQTTTAILISPTRKRSWTEQEFRPPRGNKRMYGQGISAKVTPVYH